MKINRIGEIKLNNFGTIMVIEDYKNYENILVNFPDHEYKTYARYDNFIRGKVKSPYDRSVYGVGYIGEGKYKTFQNGKIVNQYVTWAHMLKRCYDSKFHSKHPTYKNCSASDKWHNFQNFASWYDENFYQINDELMGLDKDILVKGNKIYSPDTCIFVTQSINSLFCKSNAIRGNYPIGVSWNKEKKKFESYYYNKGKRVNLGYFNSVEKAFNTYKVHKENLIKEIANEYKNKIPSKLYEAMIKYEVEIND